MIGPDDLDPLKMLDPGINEIIAKSNTHIEVSKKQMGYRLSFGATPLYHTVLAKMLKESTVVTMVKRKPSYPEKRYLGNVVINYLPDHHAWKITITNGGSKRKNAKKPLKIMETFYLRKASGSYWVDREFEEYHSEAP